MTSSEINLELNGVDIHDKYCQVGESFCIKPAPEHWEKSSFLDPTLIEFEREMQNSMMGKIMENFEKQMMEQTKMIDNMKHEQEQNQKRLTKEKYSKHIPSQLKNEGVKSSTIWHTVHEFLTNPNFDCIDDFNNGKANMKCLDPQTYQILLSHGIGAWLSTLNSDHLDKLVKKIYTETSQWISKIWRFRGSASLFHNKQYDGFLNICKVALADRYPKYYSDGYHALYSHAPVIYINTTADPYLLDFLRINLGLPVDSISLVPNNLELGGDESMDLVILEQIILADISAGKLPLIIYAFAGSPNTGSMDQLTTIHQLCRVHKIWLHIEGFQLAQLSLLQVPAKVNAISSKVKSMTLDLGSWLGIPAIPYVTLVMTDVNETYLHKLGFGVYNGMQNKLVMEIFPIWVSLQLMGHDGITEKIESNSKLNNQIFKSLKDIPSLRVISRVKPTKSKSVKSEDPGKLVIEASGIKNLVDTVLTFLLEGNQIPSVIVFRYNPSSTRIYGDDMTKSEICQNHLNENSTIKKPRFVNSEDCELRIYLNSLNQWLADNLSVSYPQISLKTISLPSEGLCLRICTQENIIGQDIKMDDVNKFVESVKHCIAIMDSTVSRRCLFQEIVSSRNELIFVELPAWAGLGSVIYLPESYRDAILYTFAERLVEDTNINFLHFLASSHYLEDINNFNRALILELRNDDEAYSLGRFIVNVSDESDEASDETMTLFCIRLGLITEVTLIDQLIDHILKKAHQVEESSKYLEKLSQLVKDGIVKVTEDLAREQEEKVKQDGIFRQVPYIDSLINWWSPPAKTQIIGRSLNLSSGEINVTEDIYKYKMQLQTGPKYVFSIGSDNNMDSELPEV